MTGITLHRKRTQCKLTNTAPYPVAVTNVILHMVRVNGKDSFSSTSSLQLQGSEAQRPAVTAAPCVRLLPLPAICKVVAFAPGTGPSGPNKEVFLAATAGELARVGRPSVLARPATGELGSWAVTRGGAPKLEGLLPAAVSRLIAAPAWAQSGVLPWQVHI